MVSAPGLTFVALLLLATIASAKAKRAPDWLYKRIFPASDKPLLKDAIDASRPGKEALRTLLEYYGDIDETMRPSVTEDDMDNLEESNVPAFLTFYGWPAMNERQIVFEPAMLRNKADKKSNRKKLARFAAFEKRVFEALIALGTAVDSPTARKSVKDFLARRKDYVLQWKHVFHDSRTNYTTDENTHSCIVRSNLAFRVNGTWSIYTSVTNDRPEANRRDYERIVLREVFTLGGPAVGVQSFPYLFDINYKPELKYWGSRAYNRGANDAFVPTKVASIFSEFSGPAGVHFFNTKPVGDNVAVKAALADSETLTRQVLDTKVWSNTAILLFPLFLALVPVALFADVSDRVLLGYMVFTDFLAVLPLAITGGVLIAAGRREYFSTRTLVRGMPADVASTLVASTWSCKCTAAGNIIAYGAAFVAIAVVAVVVGVGLEFFVKNMVEENKRIAEWKFPPRTGMGEYSEYYWVRGAPCNECECGERSVAQQTGSVPTIGGGLIGQIQQRRQEENQRSVLSTIGTGL